MTSPELFPCAKVLERHSILSTLGMRQERYRRGAVAGGVGGTCLRIRREGGKYGARRFKRKNKFL